MPITVINRPNAFNTWSAVFNPVVYKFQRKDFNITAFATSGGALQITVNANLTTLTTAQGGPVVAGSILWVSSDNGVYNAAYSVVSVTNAASSVVTFGASTYTSAATTGYINLQQRTGYNLRVRLYAGNGTASSSPLFTMSFTPDKAGLITADVSQLKNYMTPKTWDFTNKITNSSRAYKVRTNTSTSLKFYIDRQEVWTSSAESITSDSANQFFVVYAARQIPSVYGGYLKEYSDSTNRKFLTPFIGREIFSQFTPPNVFSGKPFTISFIDPSPNGTTRTHVKKRRFLANGTPWGSTYDLSDYSGGTPNGNIFESFEDFTSDYALLYDRQTTGGVSWTIPSYTGLATISGSSGTSNRLIFPFETLQVGLTTNYRINASISLVGAGVTMNLRVIDSGGSFVIPAVQRGLSPGLNDINFDFNLESASGEGAWIGLDFTFFASTTITINSFTIKNVPTSNKVVYSLVTLTTTFPTNETSLTDTSNPYIVQLTEPCTPSVHLIWKNHLGGDSSWCFTFNQSFNIKADKNKKLRSAKLYSDLCTYDDVLSISELASSGEIYDVPYTELTSSIIDTQERSGANVIAIDDSGNPVGVVVTDTNFSSDTSKSIHQVSLTIQYPEIIHPQ